MNPWLICYITTVLTSLSMTWFYIKKCQYKDVIPILCIMGSFVPIINLILTIVFIVSIIGHAKIRNNISESVYRQLNLEKEI